jgi:hypothetical protein
MYRLWIVSNKQMMLLCFPMFLWLGGLVCGILQVYLQAMHINDPDFGPYHWATVNMDVGPGIVLTPFWGSTTVLNTYCTSESPTRNRVMRLMYSLARYFDLENLESIKERCKQHCLETAPTYCPHPHGIRHFVLHH